LSELLAIRRESNFGESIVPLTEQEDGRFLYPATRYSVPPITDLSSKAGDARLRAFTVRASFIVIERWQVLDIETL
jgi:hypothetical protein